MRVQLEYILQIKKQIFDNKNNNQEKRTNQKQIKKQKQNATLQQPYKNNKK